MKKLALIQTKLGLSEQKDSIDNATIPNIDVLQPLFDAISDDGLVDVLKDLLVIYFDRKIDFVYKGFMELINEISRYELESVILSLMLLIHKSKTIKE